MNHGNNNNDHNAFYIEIRSGNREDLETLINLNDKSPPDTQQSTDYLLAKAYEELKLKGVPLTKDMEFFVEEKLINLRFFIERNDQNEKKVEPSVENVKKRIETLCYQINQMKKGYLGEIDKEVDGEFILIARFVAQNIHILKRQLKSTYDKLPWEEMEFCVVIFVSSHTKHQEFNVVYKLILDKARLLNHLTNFEETLKKSDITKDVNSRFPLHAYKHLSARNSAIQAVIESNSSFQELYNDYKILKDVYSLKRIESYVELASSINLDQKPELGILAIERTLQVIGESLKNTLDSPNVSDEICKMLLDSAQNDFRKTITSLRNLLSNSRTLPKKEKLEDGQNLDIFREIQVDLRIVGVDIGDILYKRKVDAMRIFLNKTINCNDLQEVKKFADSLTEAELGEIKLEYEITKELVKTRKMIDELSNLINDKTEEEQGLFGQINEILDPQIINLIDVKLKNKKGLADFDSIINEINSKKDLLSIKKKCQNLLNAIKILISTEKLQNIVYLAKEIVDRVTPRKQDSETNIMRKLIDNITYTIELETGMNKGINGFKERLEEKVNDQEVIQEVELIFKDIEQEIEDEQVKNIFLDKLHEAKKAYQKEQDLKTLFSESKEEPKKLDALVVLLGLKKKKKDEFIKNHSAQEWDKCQKVLDGRRNAYQTFLDSVKNSINDGKFNDIASHLKDFLNSIIKIKDQPDELNKVIDNIFKEKMKQLDSRLQTLTYLVESNNLEFIQKCRQDKKIQAAVEMVILDLTGIIEQDGLFGDSQLFFDSYSPILIGKALRNYLAHGDPLIDTLPFEPSTAIIANALKIAAEEKTSFKKKNILIGQIVREDSANLANRYDHSWNFIKIQNEMFTAAKQGQLEKLKNCIKAGADIKAQDIKGRTGVEFAVLGDHVEVLKFFFEQSLNIDSQSLLTIAVVFDKINVISYLLEKVDA